MGSVGFIFRFGRLAGVFPGIARKVFQKDLQNPEIPLGSEPFGDVEADRPGLLAQGQLPRDGLGKGAQIDPLPPQLDLAQP